MYWLAGLYERLILGNQALQRSRQLQTNRRRGTPAIQAVEILETRTLLSVDPVAISSGETVMGTISTNGEQDSYTIDAATGEDLLLTIGEANGFQLEVTLFAPDGMALPGPS